MNLVTGLVTWFIATTIVLIANKRIGDRNAMIDEQSAELLAALRKQDAAE